MTLELRHLERPAAGTPEGALVLLHGRGADEHDLFPLLDALDPERRLLGITPRAPLALPPGGAHWYRLGGIPTPDADTFFPSFEALAAFLDDMPVSNDRVVLTAYPAMALLEDGQARRPGHRRAVRTGLRSALGGLAGRGHR